MPNGAGRTAPLLFADCGVSRFDGRKLWSDGDSKDWNLGGAVGHRDQSDAGETSRRIGFKRKRGDDAARLARRDEKNSRQRRYRSADEFSLDRLVGIDRLTFDLGGTRLDRKSLGVQARGLGDPTQRDIIETQ